MQTTYIVGFITVIIILSAGIKTAFAYDLSNPQPTSSADNSDDKLDALRAEIHESFGNMIAGLSQQFEPIKKYYDYKNEDYKVVKAARYVADNVVCDDGYYRTCFGYSCPCLPKVSGSFLSWMDRKTGASKLASGVKHVADTLIMTNIPPQVNRTLHLNSTKDQINIVVADEVYYLDKAYYFYNQSYSDVVNDLFIGNYTFFVTEIDTNVTDLLLAGKLHKGRLVKHLEVKVVHFVNCTRSLEDIKMIWGRPAAIVANACVGAPDVTVVLPAGPGFHYIFENETDAVRKKFGKGLCEVRNISEPMDLIRLLMDETTNCTAILSMSKNVSTVETTLSGEGIDVYIGDLPLYVVNKTLAVLVDSRFKCPDSGDSRIIEVYSDKGKFMGNAFAVRGYGVFTPAHVLLTKLVHHGDGVVLCMNGVAYETKRIKLSMAFDLAQLDASTLPTEPSFEWDPAFLSGRCEVVSSIDGSIQYRDRVVIAKLKQEPKLQDRMARIGQYDSYAGMSGAPVLCDGKIIGYNAAGGYGVAYVLPFVDPAEWSDVVENYAEWYQVSLMDKMMGVKYHSADAWEFSDYLNSHVYVYVAMLATFSIMAWTLFYTQGVFSIYYDEWNDARLKVAASAASAGVLNYRAPVKTVWEHISHYFPALLNKYTIILMVVIAYFQYSNPIHFHGDGSTWLGNTVKVFGMFVLYFVAWPASVMKGYQDIGDPYALGAVVLIIFLFVNIVVGIPAFWAGRAALVALKGTIKTNADMQKLAVFEKMSYIFPSNPLVNLVYHFLWIVTGRYLVTSLRDAHWHTSSDTMRVADLFVAIVVLGSGYFALCVCEFQKFVYSRSEAIATAKEKLTKLLCPELDPDSLVKVKRFCSKLMFYDTTGSVSIFKPANNPDRLSRAKKLAVEAASQAKTRVSQAKEAEQKTRNNNKRPQTQGKNGKVWEKVTVEPDLDSHEVPDNNNNYVGSSTEWIETVDGLQALLSNIKDTLDSLNWTEDAEEDLVATLCLKTTGMPKIHAEARKVYSLPYVAPVPNQIFQITPEPYEPDLGHTIVTGVAIFLACFYSSLGRSMHMLFFYAVLSSIMAFVLSFLQRYIILRPLILGDEDKREYYIRFLYRNGYVIYGVSEGTDHPDVDLKTAKSYTGPDNFTTANKVVTYVFMICAIFITEEFSVTLHSAADPMSVAFGFVWLLPLVALVVFGASPFGRKKITKAYSIVVSPRGEYVRTEIDLENAGEMPAVPRIRSKKATRPQAPKKSPVILSVVTYTDDKKSG